jgi:serine phosphatase RsbU (regulator of sigma subunit)
MNATLLSTTMESTALALCDSPGVSAVSIRSGKRVKSYGECNGVPRASWSLGSNVHVEVWGDEAPAVDAMIELARMVDLREQEIHDLAEALTNANDRQIRLFELGRLTADSLDQIQTVQKVLRYAAALTDSDEAVVLMRPTTSEWMLNARIETPEPCETGWLGPCAIDAARSGNLRPTTISGHRQMLIAEVPGDDVAYLLIVGKTSEVTYGTAERKILNALAMSLSSSLRLISLHESTMQSAVMENEHATCTALTSAVLQTSLPVMHGIEFAAQTVPARNVGGDFYSAIVADGSVRFVVGDVAGKGLPAAVLMTNAITAANYIFTHSADPEATAVQLLQQISDALEPLLISTNRFITMVVGIAVPDVNNPGAVHLSMANAGHSPVVLRQAGVASLIPPLSPPVGVGHRATGSGFCAILEGDDSLFIGSDGLLEQPNNIGDHFGQERLNDLISQHEVAAALVRNVFDAVSAFGEDQPASDDQTVFLLRPRHCRDSADVEMVQS